MSDNRPPIRPEREVSNFGPELSPQKLARRTAIVNWAGAAVSVLIVAGVLFGALVAPLMID